MLYDMYKVCLCVVPLFVFAFVSLFPKFLVFFVCLLPAFFRHASVSSTYPYQSVSPKVSPNESDTFGPSLGWKIYVKALNARIVYEGLNACSKVYLSKEYFCEIYPSCVSSKLCKFILF